MSRVGPRLEYQHMATAATHEVAWTLMPEEAATGTVDVRAVIFTDHGAHELKAKLVVPSAAPALVAAVASTAHER